MKLLSLFDVFLQIVSFLTVELPYRQFTSKVIEGSFFTFYSLTLWSQTIITIATRFPKTSSSHYFQIASETHCRRKLQFCHVVKKSKRCTTSSQTRSKEASQERCGNRKDLIVTIRTARAHELTADRQVFLYLIEDHDSPRDRSTKTG